MEAKRYIAVWQQPEEIPELTLTPSDYRRRFWFIASLTAIAVICSLYASYRFIRAAYTPPKVIAFDSRTWALSGALKPFSYSKDEMYALFDREITMGFLWNENGPLTPLEPFYEPAPLANQKLLFSKDRFKDGFSATAEIIERRPSGQKGRFVIMRYKLRIIVQNEKTDMSYVDFFEVAFRRGEMTDSNPLGYKVFILNGLKRDEYYREEADAARKAKLGQDS